MASAQAGEFATPFVRPETLRLAPAGRSIVGIYQGIIRRVAYLGSTIEYEIDWDGMTLLAVIGGPLKHGLLPERSRVAFDFPGNTAHILCD